MPQGILKSEFARLMGVVPSAVTKAIKTGRIEEEPDGTIDPDKAARQWRASSQPRKGGKASRKRPAAPVAPSTAAGSPPSTLAQANAAVKAYEAQIKRLKLQQMAGVLVNRERAERLAFAWARQIRDAWIAWGARVAAHMAADVQHQLEQVGEVDQRFFNILIDKYVHEHLVELADGPPPVV